MLESTAAFPITHEVAAILDNPIQDTVTAAPSLIIDLPIYLPLAIQQPLAMDLPIEQPDIGNHVIEPNFVPDSTELLLDSQPQHEQWSRHLFQEAVPMPDTSEISPNKT